MPAQADRPNPPPLAMSDLLAFHAHELAPFLQTAMGMAQTPTDPTIARVLAEEASRYALAAFDPQNASEVAQLRCILRTTYVAHDRRGTGAFGPQLRATAAMLLKLFEQRQVWMRMREGPRIPGRRKAPKPIEMPPVVALPEGVAHWLDLVTDPTLRSRLDVR